MTSKHILIALPDADFDPTEVAVTWQQLRAAGFRVSFASISGRVSSADDMMLSGEGLDLWGALPFFRRFKLLGLLLRANSTARKAYQAMLNSAEFNAPLPYTQLQQHNYDGLILPGGHRARGMCAYLENQMLQHYAAEFLASNKPVGAICHGSLILARAKAADGKSALYNRNVTGLTWALEGSAWRLMRFMGRFWDANYYRTYPELADEPNGFRSVQAEMIRAMKNAENFKDVPANAKHHFMKCSGLFRDTATDSRAAFVVVDGNLVTARWPGDVHLFAQSFIALFRHSTENAE
jgi:putative intracellular protease/amidase